MSTSDIIEEQRIREKIKSKTERLPQGYMDLLDSWLVDQISGASNFGRSEVFREALSCISAINRSRERKEALRELTEKIDEYQREYDVLD